MSEILEEIKPRFWFSAHLHCYFNAYIDDAVEFLALDKPLPKRQYLDVSLVYLKFRFLKYLVKLRDFNLF